MFANHTIISNKEAKVYFLIHTKINAIHTHPPINQTKAVPLSM